MVLRDFNCTLCAASNAKTLIKKTFAAERQIHQLTDTTISITINRQRKTAAAFAAGVAAVCAVCAVSAAAAAADSVRVSAFGHKTVS